MSNPDGELRLPPEHERRIAGWLQKVKFRKQIFGGISESDVFRKIGELNDLYKEALIAERARYDALLAAKAPEAETGAAQTPEAGEAEKAPEAAAEGGSESGGDAE